MEVSVTGSTAGMEINTIVKHAKATAIAFSGPPTRPNDHGAPSTSSLPFSNDIAMGMLKASVRHMTETPMMALNAAEDPSSSRPMRSWMVTESRKAFIGTALLVTREKKGENGMALSRAKAQVAREAAQRMETVQNMPVPKTRKLSCLRSQFRHNPGWRKVTQLMNHYNFPR
jgi:hypothetical protein